MSQMFDFVEVVSVNPKNTWNCFLVVSNGVANNIIAAFKSMEEANHYLNDLGQLKNILRIEVVPGLEYAK